MIAAPTKGWGTEPGLSAGLGAEAGPSEKALQTIRVLRRDTWSASSTSPEMDLQRDRVLNWERGVNAGS